MNDKKNSLLRQLRLDGRKKLTEISSSTGIPVSTLFDLIHTMNRDGWIRHETSVNFSKLGYNIHMMTALKTSIENRNSLLNYLHTQPNVNSIFKINSGFDFMIETVFRNQNDAQQFLEKLKANNHILSSSMYNIIDVINREQFLTQESHFQ